MWNSCLITKCTLALLDSSKSTRRVDLALSLADFGPLAVVTHDFLIKFHHITFHWRHLCKPAKPNLIVSHENFLDPNQSRDRGLAGEQVWLAIEPRYTLRGGTAHLFFALVHCRWESHAARMPDLFRFS